jgi:hypothetical protein
MTRSRRSRVLTALLGLWFMVVGQEPPFPHPCEMGMAAASAMATEAAGSASAADEHAEHAAHGDHAAHAGMGEDRPGDAPSHNTCECIGDCCCTPAIDRVAAGARVESHEVPTFVVRTPGIARAPSTTTRYLLPWANGPPGALS